MSTQVSCHCRHKCLDSVHTSVVSLSTQASCHYTHKHVNIQTSVTSLSKLVFQTSVVIIQRSVTSLSKQATSLSKQPSRHYPNKRHVIMQTSVTSFIIQTRQASRHYPNKRPNPSIDTPHRTGTLGMTMYTHINYSQCTTVNRCCTSLTPCCTTADSFPRLLPSQC